MKKGKDYAKMILESPEYMSESASEVMKQMFLEVKEIAIMRNVKKDDAFNSIIEEQSKKWKAVCRIVNEGREKAFLDEEVFKASFLDFLDMIKEKNQKK